MSDSHVHFCIIGMGPRGLSVLERLCANSRRLPNGTRITVHVVDPYPPGPGRVWRTEQSSQLLMNTISSQVSLFTDDSVTMSGPLEPGPTLYEWAHFLALMSPEDRDDDTVTEARALGPDDYPSRAFYGRYLAWTFDRIVGSAPAGVSIFVHTARAVALDDTDGDPRRQQIRLDNGETLTDLTAVALTLGHLEVTPSPEEAELARFAGANGLIYLPSGNPADSDLGRVPAGATVAVRGLGLNFFDLVALLTLGRGGSFERRDGHLVYLSSGQEPRVYAGSRRGAPYHARGENQKDPFQRHAPAVLTPMVVEALRTLGRSGGGLDFRQDIWPLIAKEVETVYYATLLKGRTCSCVVDEFRDAFLLCPWGSDQENRLLRQFGLDDAPWDWLDVTEPAHGRALDGPEVFRSWLLDHLRRDVRQAREGNVDNPVKAALDVLRDLRNEARLLVDHGGLTGDSYKRHLDGWYTPMNAFLSIGPPVQRVEQLVALIEAGIVIVTGPNTRIRPGEGGTSFFLTSDIFDEVRATVLIEARMPTVEVRRTSDPLLRHLLSTGQSRSYTIPNQDGPPYEAGGLSVTPRPYHVVDAGGAAHPARFLLGIPTESVHWATAAGIRPAVDSVILGDSDAVARAMIGLAGTVAPSQDRQLHIGASTAW